MKTIWAHKWAFLFWVFVIVAATYAILRVLDIIPNQPLFPLSLTAKETPSALSTTEADAQTSYAANPRGDATPNTITIDRLAKTLTINNPTATDVAALDNSLLSGVVRYPSSATMNDDGTMLIFGHSSHLAIVHNQNFRAFNGIETLSWGDLIHVRSDDYEYVYRVDTVKQLNATAASIPLQHVTKKLVLVTCNNFGAKEDRYVVEATLIDARAI